MFRSLSYASAALAVVAGLARPAVVAAQADTRPVVVVFRFDNNSIGTGRADFDGMATGVQDLLITDLASNSKIRLVDRAHLNDILTEQKLSQTGQVDPATAVRVGKILGAQYAITGGFLSDGKGSAVLTGRTIDIETTQIANPQKITGKADDVLGLITQLSERVSSNMNLAPKPGADRRSDNGSAAAPVKPAPSNAAPVKPAPSNPAPASHADRSQRPAAPAQASASKSTGSQVELYRKPLTKPQSMKTKLDVATMKTYSNALDEMDRNNPAKARQLFQQVVDKYPEFEPAQRNLKSLSSATGH